MLPSWLEELLRTQSNPTPERAVKHSVKHLDGGNVSRDVSRGGVRCDNVLRVACGHVRHAQPGNRNQTLNREAFSVFGAFAADNRNVKNAADELLHAAKDAGLGESEALRTMRSAYRAGRARPLAQRPPEPQCVCGWR